VPDLGRINQMSALGAADAWAVADCGLLRWNGTSWARVTFPVPPGAQRPAPALVAADRPHDAWLLASDNSAARGTGWFLDHWNGRDWQLMSLPDLGENDSLDAIDARAPADVLVAGTDYTGDNQTPARPEQLILLHWDGYSWTRTSEPSTGMWTKRVTGLKILSADDVWMAGWGKATPGAGALRHPLTLHWNGTKWSSAPVPSGPGEVYQVARAGHDLWAVGDTFSPSVTSYTMVFLRWTAAGWVHAPVPVAGEGSLFSAASARGSGLWAVGATGTSNAPVIALWN
jgi:hypothetical protein